MTLECLIFLESMSHEIITQNPIHAKKKLKKSIYIQIQAVINS
jgi:hypothetical protein